MTTYAEFLTRKAQANDAAGFEPLWIPGWLFGFQQDLTRWAIRMGRGALFADCGLGKAPMALVWAVNVHRHTGGRVIIVAPLGVTRQLEREAAKFGIDAGVSRDGRTAGASITITNYERLEKFDPADFAGAVCDESSAIKAFDGKRRAIVTEFMRTLRYRLLATATAAPNDYTELGTSSEALGWLGHMDMLNRFFVNGQRTSDVQGRWKGHAVPRVWEGQHWRFKGHAETPFWQWVASWARALRRPSDLGYDDDAFILPPLILRETVVKADTPRGDTLFDVPAIGLQEERAELRHTLVERCEAAAKQLADAPIAVAWCHLNGESRLLATLIDGAVELTGSEAIEAKEEKLAAFSDGQIRVLVSKPLIAGWGLNWQHCHRLTYFPSHSFELWYQAIRRFWRFRQEQPVTVDVITTEGGARTLANLQRKATAADRMFDALVLHMRDAQQAAPRAGHDRDMEMPPWLQ